MLFKRVFFNAVGGIAGLMLFALTMLPNTVQSAGFDISSDPLFLMQPVEPLVMLSMSRDQQLYFTAYPDYADLNEDGQADLGYIHDKKTDYYGYFDSRKCYDYASNKFTPASISITKYCSGNWSGNFLNWVSMARIDVVRKILYGGYRSTDTAAATVLERTYLPNDVHSWVKYYDGDDLDKLTPFSLPPLSTGASTTSRTIVTGDINRDGSNNATEMTFTVSSWSDASPQTGDQVVIISTDNPRAWMKGVVLSNGSPIKVQVTSSNEVGSTYDKWTIINESRRGISFCNTTVSATQLSQNVTDPPLIRVASGNYRLWAANERWQCRWSDEKSRTGHTEMRVGGTSFSNGNDISVTKIAANSDNPVKESVKLGLGDYNARVSACVSESLIGNENCKKYPNGNLKPIGLLQEYGDDGALYFGLVTGSYNKNKSGGALRKNAGVLTDEVNINTATNPATGDGTFKTGSGGIIDTLNKFRIYGYRHDDGTYSGVTGSDACSLELTSFSDGTCSNWGNPQSEIFLETLRYFAGAAASSDYTGGTDRLNLISATWADPLSTSNWCAALNVINFNTSINSYDDNQFSGLSSLGSGLSISGLTDVVGSGEGIHGKQWFIGESGSSTNKYCDAKNVSSLGATKGLCPEAPSQAGTFHIAGLAHYAYTNDIRPLTGDQVVKTYGVAMAPAVPRIEIPLPGKTKSAVTILPACENTTEPGRCQLADFKIISQDVAAGTGSFLIEWDAAAQGSDYDTDISGVLSYTITTTQIKVSTKIFAQSSSRKTAFGYIISGTTKDGFHAHSGINEYSYTDPTGVLACNKCTYKDLATEPTYTLGSSSADLLKDPLYYAAKWGGYNKDLKHPTTSVGFPTYQPTWDSKGAQGTNTPDGKPDNYYYAVDPARLAQDLGEVFNNVKATVGSSSAVASNSTSQNTVDALYQAKLNSDDWSGQLLRYSLATNGTIIKTPAWDTHSTMSSISAASRKVYTFGSTGGVDFAWANLTLAQQTFLKDGGTEADATKRINWIRGDRAEEATGFLRKRNWLLGDIINSNPFYHKKTNTVYVGANDGMLHAFDATSGAEKFAYIPKSVYANLAKLTKPTYKEDGHHYFVDGSPIIVDTATQSILVGTTGAGGRSVFALDVSGTSAAGTVLWEFTAPDLGYTIGQPVIGSIDGTKVVVFGNGYNSDNHRAMLYVLKLETGELFYPAINTGIGDAANPNGLASPGLLPDTAGDAIAAYAGDARGNLWKFDLSSGTVAFSGQQPLFEAAGPAPGNLQPISGGVDIGRHPNGGYLIFFGTGKYFEVNDKQIGTQIHSLYGIWDKGDGSTVSGRGVLQQQTILGQSYTVGNNFRLLSKTPVNWATKRGWYVDLAVDKNGHSTCNADGESCTATGERVMEKPLLNRGQVFFTTLTPYDSGLPCEPIGTTWFLALDMLTGGELKKASFDVNRDFSFDQYDTITVTLADGTTATGFTSGFEAIAAGIAKATLIETPTGGTNVVFSGIEDLTTTASATSNSDRASIQGADAAVAAAQTAGDSATTAADAAEAAAQAKTDADNAADAAPDDAALADAAVKAGEAKDHADDAARQANRDAAQAIVDAAQAIINAAQDIINAGGIGGVTVSDAQGVIAEATTIKGQAQPFVTSGDTPPPGLVDDLRRLLGILKGSKNEGVGGISIFPPKTWRQLQ